MFSQFKTGFLRGVGFSVAFILALVIVYALVFSVFEDWVSDMEGGDYVEFGSDVDLKPTILSYKVHENTAVLLGVIQNNTEHSWGETNIEIEFYFGDEFVKECSAEILTKIEPNHDENFEVSCESCGDKFPEFDRVEIKINDSWTAD